MSQTQTLKVGILLCTGGVQLLDLAAVDLLAILSTKYMRSCGLPENVVAMGHEVEFHYIVDVVKGEGGVEVPTEYVTSADLTIRVTDTLDSVGDLDILVVPGPALTYVPSAETVAFMQKHASSSRTRAILSICSGILPVALSGVLSGKRATAPIEMLPTLREKVPDVEWVAKRWTTDVDDKDQKKIWTSGIVTNGTDMVAAYIKENFDPQLAKLVCGIADVQEREQEYPEWQLNRKLFEF